MWMNWTNTGKPLTDEKELPSTVTFLVSVEQAKVLAELEQESELHLALVFRGTPEKSAAFIEAQDALIQDLYAEPEDVPEDAAQTDESEGAEQGGESEAPDDEL